MQQRIDVIKRHQEAFLFFVINYAVLTLLVVEARWEVFGLGTFWVGVGVIYLVIATCSSVGYVFGRLTAPARVEPDLDTTPPGFYFPVFSQEIDELFPPSEEHLKMADSEFIPALPAVGSL